MPQVAYLDVLTREHGGEAVALPVGQQVGPDAQHPPDPVERIPGATSVPAGGLLDALAAAVQGVTGHGDDVEWIHRRDRVGQRLGGGGLEAGEPVHRDDLDHVAEHRALLGEPAGERCGASAASQPAFSRERAEADLTRTVTAAAASAANREAQLVRLTLGNVAPP